MSVQSATTHVMRGVNANITPLNKSSFSKILSIKQSAQVQLTSLSFKIKTEKKFTKAILESDVDYIKQKLIKNPSLAETLLKKSGDKNKFTPLGMACYRADLAMMFELIHAGADINRTDCEGVSPLMLAVQSGSLAAVKLLLAHQPDVNQTDFWGFSPLMLAVKSGSFDMVKLLLAHNADVNQKNRIDQHSCAITAAAASGKLDILKLLIAHGANTHTKTQDDKDIYMLASRHMYLDVAGCLQTNSKAK